jgi:hypothetical protein
MHRLIVPTSFIFLLITQPLFANSSKFSIGMGSNFNSKNIFNSHDGINPYNRINIDLKYKIKNFSSNIVYNLNKNGRFNYDNSYVSYSKGIATFNIGRIDRVWSFSNKSSLILSSNSRPIEAISAKITNKSYSDLLPSPIKWSIETFGGSTKGSYSGKNSMIFGTRAIISPTERFSFELLHTAQWGGKNKKLNPSRIASIFIGESNEGENSEINKMAGFGVSYSIPINKNIYRIYGQAIGEDEAGNLPSCYSWLAGTEFSLKRLEKPTTLTIEIVDTRITPSENNHCGPNTMYNNSSYDYINYDTVLGVPIDSEGTSLEIFGQSKINKYLNIKYSMMLLTINDKDYSDHRLSSKRSTGSIKSLEIIWKRNKLNISGSISYQDLILDKSDIRKGAIFGLKSYINF